MFVFLHEGCSEDLCICFFSSFIDTLFLLCDSKPCTYDVIYIYIYMCVCVCVCVCVYDEVVITVLSPIFSCVVSLFMHMLFIYCM